MIVRAALMLTGLALVVAAAYASVEAAGGLDSPAAVIVMAVAVGAVGGALGVGHFARERRYVLASLVAFATLGCEAFGYAQTSRRLLEGLDARRAPAVAASAARQDAQMRVSRLERALASLTTTARIEAAQKASDQAQAASLSRPAERYCSTACTAQLTRVREEAAEELRQARQELAAQRAAIAAELASARQTLAGMPVPVMAASIGLHSMLGLDAASYELLEAGIGALGVNILGALLIAGAAHGPRRAPGARQPDVVTPTDEPSSRLAAASSLPAVQPSPDEHSLRFMIARLRHSPGRRVALTDLHEAYLRWCDDAGIAPLATDDVWPVLTEQLAALGVKGAMDDGVPFAVGLRIIDGPPLPALPPPSSAAA